MHLKAPRVALQQNFNAVARGATKSVKLKLE